MNGIFYGVGVGPGDPKMMTYQAVETIAACPVIAVPADGRDQAVSYKIAAGMVEGLEKKECLRLEIPMTKDRDVLHAAYQAAAATVAGVLAKGKDVAYLTLGDPTVYSTYIYIHRLVTAMGFEARIINGVPSFCAVSARMGGSLADRAEQLHIIPGSYGVKEALGLPGTKVFMKAGGKLGALRAQILRDLEESDAAGGGGSRPEDSGASREIYMVENCGMEHERVYAGAAAIPEKAGYYSVIVVRDGCPESGGDI